ncbi:hypothetical protein D3C87_580370 [compost metagenome]
MAPGDFYSYSLFLQLLIIVLLIFILTSSMRKSTRLKDLEKAILELNDKRSNIE